MDTGDVDDRAGRRRRGLVLAGIVLAVGAPLTVLTWLSERNVDQQAAELAEDVRIAARLLDDPLELWGRDVVSGSAGDPVGPLAEALGHEDRFAGALSDADRGISVVYEVRWGLATRCVHLLVRDGEVRTDVTDETSCEPRAL